MNNIKGEPMSFGARLLWSILIILTVLKVLGVISWPWWVVLSPVLGPLVILTAAGIITAFIE